MPANDPPSQNPRAPRGVVLRIIFWVLVATLYVLGLLALLLRGQTGLLPGASPPNETPIVAFTGTPAVEGIVATPQIQETATLMPTLTAPATLFPTLTPRP